MTFEEWWEGPVCTRSMIAGSAEVFARAAYSAGAEQMREKCAQIGDVARPRVAARPRKQLLTAEEGYDAATVDYSDDIRKLPVGGSSRAPEGTEK